MAAPPGRERIPFQIQPGARQFAGWAEQMSSSGRLYYYNRKTELSTWEKPQEWKEYEDKGGIIESGHSTPGSAERRPGSGDRLEKNKGGVNEKPRFAFQPPSLPPPPMGGPHIGFMGGPPPPHQQYMHYPPPGVAPHFYNQPPPPPPPGAYYPMRGNFSYRVPPPPFAVNVPPPNVVPPPPPPPAPRAPSVSTGVPPPPPPPPPPQRTPRTPGNPMYSSPRDGGYPMGGGAPPPPPPPPPPPMDAPGAHKSGYRSSGMTVSPRTPSRTPTESLYKTGVNMMNQQQRAKRSPPGPPPKEMSAKRRFDEPLPPAQSARQSRSDRMSIDGGAAGPRSPELVNPPAPIAAPQPPQEVPPTPQKKQDQSFMDRLKKIPFLTPEMLELFDEDMANEAAVKLSLQDDEDRKVNAQTRRHALAMENSGRCKLHALTLMGYTKRALEHKSGLLALRAGCLDKMINALTDASMAPRDIEMFGEAGIPRTSPAENTPAEGTPAENTPAEGTPAANTPAN